MFPRRKSPRSVGPLPPRCWMLPVLLLLAACATGHPPGGMLMGSRRPLSRTPPAAPRQASFAQAGVGLEGAVRYEVVVLEPGSAGASRAVLVSRDDFLRAVRDNARKTQLDGKSPREAAREWLRGQVEQHPEWEQRSGTWVAEVYKGRVLSLVPMDEDSGLATEASEALRRHYLAWCARGQGGGDCLRLLDDAPYLKADDRRTLALALSFGSVLEETKQALGRELDPQVVVASCMWTLGAYLALWLVPEPTTKLVAAGLSVVLVAWLGVETLWGLMDGWAAMATRAHDATTFGELREAGEGFARVLGTDAARAMILAVGALTGRTLGDVAARVRSLPGYGMANARWQAQGGAAVLERVETLAAQEGALARAVETVAATPHGPLAVVMLKKGRGGGASSGGGASGTVAIRHRGGNQQVLLPNGQRWHLPPGKSIHDIPVEDEVGDMLQKAVTEAARQWGPHRLSPREAKAIDDALKEGEYWLAHLLEREARGRFVHAQVKKQFEGILRFRHEGVDVIDPKNNRQYEILSGTVSNLARHGRRMAGEFFRMLTF
ncbi:SitA5 family polymorphic toxin [Archangium violaceum]|uniref:SitA5 family polymorphic toxin n=1 Tax=Archangium violaceum TaxID=83451 RepID=UPI003D277092